MKIYEQKASGYTEEVKEGFNGWAFLFGPFWFLVKGMVGKAILTFIVALIIYWIFDIVGVLIFWIIIGDLANRQYQDYLVKKGYSVVKHKDTKQSKEENEKELEWECDFCGKNFKTKKEAEKHEKNCKGK